MPGTSLPFHSSRTSSFTVFLVPLPSSCPRVRFHQPAFKAPLFEQQRAGMRLGIFPADKFPSGKEFFKHPHEEGNAPIHLGETLVVHNNWMVGHDRKRQRFKQYQLWDVGNSVFPSCTR